MREANRSDSQETQIDLETTPSIEVPKDIDVVGTLLMSLTNWVFL